MSSLRNAVKRSTHKERAQPKARAKLGLLEKHADYVQRAKDFNRKKDTIKKLRLKAALKNPDEFYFAMHKTKVNKDGVHEEVSSTKDLDHDTVALLKTQDLSYVQMKHTVDMNKAKRLQKSLHMLDAPAQNTHTIFVDSKKAAADFDPVKHFDTVPELAGRAFNRPTVKTLQEGEVIGAHNRKMMNKVMKKRDASYQELSQRLERGAKLKKVMNHLEVQRTVMNSKGTKKKVKAAEGDKPAVFKWKRERAR